MANKNTHHVQKCAYAGLAASFNRSAWLAKGNVIATEMRAFMNAHGYRTPDAPHALIGAIGFGPK